MLNSIVFVYEELSVICVVIVGLEKEFENIIYCYVLIMNERVIFFFYDMFI